jgi:hypothetical protein
VFKPLRRFGPTSESGLIPLTKVFDTRIGPLDTVFTMPLLNNIENLVGLPLRYPACSEAFAEIGFYGIIHKTYPPFKDV